MRDSIQQIAKEMRAAAGDFESWGRGVIEAFADRLEALQADAREKGEAPVAWMEHVSRPGKKEWIAHAGSEPPVKSEYTVWIRPLAYADATQPAQASEAAGLVEACRMLIESMPAHMCHRNKKERRAYDAIRANLKESN